MADIAMSPIIVSVVKSFFSINIEKGLRWKTLFVINIQYNTIKVFHPIQCVVLLYVFYQIRQVVIER